MIRFLLLFMFLVISCSIFAGEQEMYRKEGTLKAPNVLFLFDTSGSMSLDDVPLPYTSRLEYLKEAMKEILIELSDYGINVALSELPGYKYIWGYDYRYEGGRITKAFDFLTYDNLNTYIDSIDELEADGTTPMGEALVSVWDHFFRNNQIMHTCRKNIVFLISDGEPTEDYPVGFLDAYFKDTPYYKNLGIYLYDRYYPDQGKPDVADVAKYLYSAHIDSKQLLYHTKSEDDSLWDHPERDDYCDGNRIEIYPISYIDSVKTLYDIALVSNSKAKYYKATSKQNLIDSVTDGIGGKIRQKMSGVSATPTIKINPNDTKPEYFYLPSFRAKKAGPWWGTISKLCSWVDSTDVQKSNRTISGDTEYCYFLPFKYIDNMYMTNTEAELSIYYEPESISGYITLDEEKYQKYTKHDTSWDSRAKDRYTDNAYKTIDNIDAPYEVGVAKVVKDRQIGNRRFHYTYYDDKAKKSVLQPVQNDSRSPAYAYMQGYSLVLDRYNKQVKGPVRDNPMGDFWHSSPLQVEKDGKKRLLAGSNAGFFHVFGDDSADSKTFGAEVYAVAPSSEIYQKHQNLTYSQNKFKTNDMYGPDYEAKRLEVGDIDYVGIGFRRGGKGYTLIDTDSIFKIHPDSDEVVRWKSTCSSHNIQSEGRCNNLNNYGKHVAVWYEDEETCSIFHEQACKAAGGEWTDLFGYSYNSPSVITYKNDNYIIAPYGYSDYFDSDKYTVSNYRVSHTRVPHFLKIPASRYSVTSKNIEKYVFPDIDYSKKSPKTGDYFPVVGKIYPFTLNETYGDYYKYDVSHFKSSNNANVVYYSDLIGNVYTADLSKTTYLIKHVFELGKLSGQDMERTSNKNVLKVFGSVKPVIRDLSKGNSYEDTKKTLRENRQVWLFMGTGDITRPVTVEGD